MALRNNEPQTPDIRQLQQLLAATQHGLTALGHSYNGLELQVTSLLRTRTQFPAAPVSNLLWNGELGHSVNSWNDTAYQVNDKALECAWWYSHNKPAEITTFTSADVSVGSDTITLAADTFSTGQTVDLMTTGTLPGGLALWTGTYYFIYRVSAGVYKLCTSLANALAGTAVDIVSGGTGTHTIQERLLLTNAVTSSTNNELKRPTHTTYSARYSRWNIPNGWGELTGTKSIDSPLPANFVDATTILARASLIAAKKNEFIEITDTCMLGCGLWDNTPGQRKFLAGDIGLTAAVIGTPAVGVERRYRVLLTSDQGYQLLSSVVTITTAPKDSEFSTSVFVALGWEQQAGQLEAEIYEYLPVGPEGGGSPEYRLIQTLSSQNSYIHYGAYLKVELGYPTATGSVRTATYYTKMGELAALATNGVSASWDTVNFPLGVPNNYNKGNTTDRQWLRFWLTEAPNLLIPGCSTNGTTTITLPAGAIDSSAAASGGYGTGSGSLYAGLAVEVYDSLGAPLASSTVSSVTSDTVIDIGSTVSIGTGRVVRIVGGGFHGVFIDKLHLGFQQNTSYTPNAFDVRTLQPLAAPASSTQGGTGAGGSGGGIINYCVAEHTPIEQENGEWKEIRECRAGDLWDSAGLEPNVLAKLNPGFEFVRRVTSENGVELLCTDTERFVVSRSDLDGTPLFRLRVGDTVLTKVNGRIEASRIASIGPLLIEAVVYTPTLTGTHYFIAGRIAEDKGTSLLKRAVIRLRRVLRGGGKKRRTGGFILHNRKADTWIDVPPV